MNILVATNFLSKGNTIFLKDDPRENQLIINNVDYYACSVSPQFKRNKGAHSYVLALYPSQDFIDIYNTQPQKVIKISNVSDFYRNGDYVGSDANERFRIEVSALEDCKRNHIPNIIEIDLQGHIQCTEQYMTRRGEERKVKAFFPFYMMDYADGDLKQYLEEHNINKSKKNGFMPTTCGRAERFE